MEQTEEKRLADRLARIEGQIRGIRSMLESGRTCEDMLTQVLAVRSSLERCSTIMLEHHLRDCVIGTGELDEERWHRLRETLDLWSRHSPGV